MMKAVVIDPKEKTVVDVEKDWTLNELQAAVGGYIEDGGLASDYALWVNEEGLLMEEEKFFFVIGPMKGNPPSQALCGTCVVLGVNRKTGESIDTPFNAEEIRKALWWKA